MFRAADYRPLHNHIVRVHDHDVGRLVGIHYDIYDVYYAVHHIKDGIEPFIRYYSAVGGCDTLKDEPIYDILDRTHTKYGAPPTDRFLITRQMKEYQCFWYFDGTLFG